MSGDWMKVELSLPEKPEVFQIAGVLNIDPDLVVGKLIKVWSWFDRQTQNGNAHGVTFALVDRLTGVAGFGDAMANAGWLTQRGMSLVVPAFDKHNGKTAKTRALSSKRQQRFRNDGVDASVTQEALPREEKRREEEKSSGSDDPPRIPYQAIVDSYNSTMTNLPKVREITDGRKTLMRRWWHASQTRQDLAFVRSYFEECADDPFLNGTGPYGNGHRNWRPSFEFLLDKDRATQVYERAMHRMEQGAVQ